MPDLKEQFVIADTSVLYYLNQISLLELLPKLYGQITVTPEVLSELEAGAKQGLAVPNVKAMDCFSTQSITIPKFIDLIPDLGKGEASVLALAIELDNALLILDDLLARKVAHFEGLQITGTIGVMIRARKEGWLPELKPSLMKLAEAGFYLSEHLFKHALYVVGESNETQKDTKREQKTLRLTIAGDENG